MRYSKFIVHAVLLFTVPSLTLYTHLDIPVTTIQPLEMTKEPENRLTSGLWTVSYNEVLNLINDLETGELEKKCNLGELERINLFLVHMAKLGILPNETEEEFILENDIQELLDNDNPFSNIQKNELFVSTQIILEKLPIYMLLALEVLDIIHLAK